jgi:hypothetical protein
VDEEARPADEDQRQQPEQDEHAGRHVDRKEAVSREDQPRLDDGHIGHQRQHRHQYGLRDPQVLGLRRVAHPVPVEAEQREDRDAAHDGEADRALQQVLVDLGDAGVEPQPVGEVVGQRDQYRVQRDLRHRMAVDGEGRGAHPAAHPRHSRAASGRRRTAVRAEAR